MSFRVADRNSGISTTVTGAVPDIEKILVQWTSEIKVLPTTPIRPSRRFQPVDAEQASGIAPHRPRRESGLGSEGAEILDGVFLRPFGVDRFALGERNRTAADSDELRRRADEIHLDALLL